MRLRTLEPNEDKQDPIFNSKESQQLLKIYEDYYPKIGFNYPWVAYVIIKKNQVVGTCSFTGKPIDGKVEIAYWTFKEYEKQGIASFACKELIAIAKKEVPNIVLTAKTAPENNISTRILKNNGFIYSRVVQDDDIGDAWLWILQDG